jgi:hypothetical protein
MILARLFDENAELLNASSERGQIFRGNGIIVGIPGLYISAFQQLEAPTIPS